MAAAQAACTRGRGGAGAQAARERCVARERVPRLCLRVRACACLHALVACEAQKVEGDEVDSLHAAGQRHVWSGGPVRRAARERAPACVQNARDAKRGRAAHPASTGGECASCASVSAGTSGSGRHSAHSVSISCAAPARQQTHTQKQRSAQRSPGGAHRPGRRAARAPAPSAASCPACRSAAARGRGSSPAAASPPQRGLHSPASVVRPWEEEEPAHTRRA